MPGEVAFFGFTECKLAWQFDNPLPVYRDLSTVAGNEGTPPLWGSCETISKISAGGGKLGRVS